MGWPGDRVEATPRGRSGLHRARWWVTPTRGDPRESATENRPPVLVPTRTGKGETVVQETTSDRGDPAGSANPTWSKVKKSGAFGHRTRARSRAARPSARVDRWRVSATALVDGWSPPSAPPGAGGTEPGLQASPSAHTPQERNPDPVVEEGAPRPRRR